MNALLKQPAIEVPQKRLAAHRTACISLPMLGRIMGAAAQPGGLRCDASRQAVTAAPAIASKGKQVVQHVAEPTSPATPPLFSQQTASAVVCMLTAYHLVLFAAMIVNGQWLRKFMRSLWPFLPLALGYGLLLFNSWSPDTLSIMMPGSIQEGLKGFNPQFVPKIEGISALFQRPLTAASWLIHIWAINLFLGRVIYTEGGVPTWHSLLLACFLGPLGYVSHALTKLVWKAAAKPVIIQDKESNGSITLLPYDQ